MITIQATVLSGKPGWMVGTGINGTRIFVESRAIAETLRALLVDEAAGLVTRDERRTRRGGTASGRPALRLLWPRAGRDDGLLRHLRGRCVPRRGRHRMSEALTPHAPPLDHAILERVLLHGDLRQLSPAQKTAYYVKVCDTLGLNPLTQPFAYIVLNGKEVLYAKREATEQLRFLRSISVKITSREVIEGCYVVTASATMPSGRVDESTGVVALDSSKGENRANLRMKCETKAKRRVTLSICGLGMLDETEVASIPGAKPEAFSPETGEVFDAEPVALPTGYAEWLAQMERAAEHGTTALRAVWKDGTPAQRSAMPVNVRDRLKQQASRVGDASAA